MRWDHLRLFDTDEASAPPLIERGAVARTFDTPEFAGLTFYEVQAKSIISTVPKSSRMPFRHTINPYRGCCHACRYCQSGDTPILMANGRTKRLADVRPGDRVYGTVRRGNYLRYTVTDVLDHWQTVKPAYRVTLADGTELVASGDHRYLTERGWKHVADNEEGPIQRAHLTPNNKLMGVGFFAEPPKQTLEYRRGYLSGMIRGDGCIHVHTYPPALGRSQPWTVHQFRLALTDSEGLARTRTFLGTFGVLTSEYDFQRPSANRKPLRAIATGSKASMTAIQDLIAWPQEPSLDWLKGFLAGVFDAEGHCDTIQGVIRISNSDSEILNRIKTGLKRLAFSFVAEKPRRSANKDVTAIRILGGLPERLRFFHTVDPAITRKKSIEGVAIKSKRALHVRSVEALGADMPMYDITTGTGDFIANGVVSHNCYARKSHEYLELDSGRDFDTKVVVKVNAADRLRRELAAPKWSGDHIAMGTNVDCYQRAEGRYRLMPGIIAALRDAANPFSILTKGTLILRDLDLLAQAARVTSVGTALSVGFTDTELWRQVEPGTPRPSARLDAVARLNDAGVGCSVMIAPILPFLTDSGERLREVVAECAAAGATGVTPIVLHLRPGAREWFLQWLGGWRPDLVPRYRALYSGGSYAAKSYQRRITAEVARLAEEFGIRKRGPRPDPEPPAPPQPTLF